MTISVIHCAIVDLASIWQTAWVNSGDLNLPFNDEKSMGLEGIDWIEWIDLYK